MKTGVNHSILAAILMVISLSTYAANDNYYLGVGLGHSSFELNESNIVADYVRLSNPNNFTDSASAFSFYGGMPVDEYLSLEFDFVLSGDIAARESGRTIKLFDVSTLAITVMLSKTVTENTTLFGKVGAHMWDISESSGSLNTINNAVDITFGLGADINIYGSQSRQLRVQWNHYEFDGIYIDNNDILSFSLLFKLGGD